MVSRFAATGGSGREHGGVRRHDALGAARHDQRYASRDVGFGDPQPFGQEAGEHGRREPARIVVDAAVALGLGQDGHDVPGVKRACVEQSHEARHVVRSRHWNSEDSGATHL
jgi:hypothetical protein